MHRRTVGVGAGIALAMLLFAHTVQSQALDEIVVTAQKREQRIQDVGISVTAFSAETLRALEFRSSIDVAAQTPGLQFVEGQEQLINIINIRGVSQNDLALHQEGPVAVYSDGAYLSFGTAANFPLFDLERIEVLRGPQGTLFGRNTTGGLVHYISHQPHDQFDAYIDLELGERSLSTVEAALGGTLSPAIAGRVSVYANNFDDYVTNLGPAGDFRSREENAARGQLRFDIGENAELRLVASALDGNTSLVGNLAPNGFDLDGLEFNLARDQNFWGNCSGCTPAGFRDQTDDPYEVEVDTPGFLDYDVASATAIVDVRLSESISLTSMTNFILLDAEHLGDGDLTPRFGATLNSFQDSEQFSQEFRLAGGRGRLNWVAGLYFFDRDADQNEIVRFGLAETDVTFSTLGRTPPGFLASLGTESRLDSTWNLDTSSLAVFGQAEFQVTASGKLIVGLRWLREELDYVFDSVETLDGFPIGPDGVFGEASFASATDNSDVSGKVAFEWRLVSSNLVYLSLSRGYKGGGFNAPFIGGPVTEFGEESLTSYEAGIKSMLADDSISLNASAFYYDYKDYQGLTVVNLVPEIRNLDAQVAGIEVEVATSLPGQWGFWAGLSLLETELTGVMLPSGRILDRELPLAPMVSFNAALSKSYRLDSGAITAQVDGVYTDAYFSEVFNSQAGRVSSRWIANVRVGFSPTEAPWSLALIVRNVTGDNNLSYRIPTGQGSTQDQFSAPRWASLQFGYRWD